MRYTIEIWKRMPLRLKSEREFKILTNWEYVYKGRGKGCERRRLN